MKRYLLEHAWLVDGLALIGQVHQPNHDQDKGPYIQLFGGDWPSCTCDYAIHRPVWEWIWPLDLLKIYRYKIL